MNFWRTVILQGTAGGPVRGLQRGLRSAPRAGRQHQHRWFAATPSPKIRPASSSTAGAVPDGPHGRPRMRWPMLEPYAWEPAEQRGWSSEQGRLSSQPSFRETSAASAPEPPRVRVAGAAIEKNRMRMLQERAEIMAQAIARSPGQLRVLWGTPRERGAEDWRGGRLRTFRHLKPAPPAGG